MISIGIASRILLICHSYRTSPSSASRLLAATVDDELDAGGGVGTAAYEHSEMLLYKAMVLEEGAARRGAVVA